MNRLAAIELIAKSAGDSLLVCNLGYPSRELYSVMDRKENFYMLGSMGLASSIGLGLALAKPDRKVIALDGDGSIIMNLGSLSTIASRAPDNYLLIILDNGVYGSTGDQPSATSGETNLGRVAEAAGIVNVREVTTARDLRECMRTMRSGVLVAKVKISNAKVPIIDLEPKEILDRFMKAARASPSA
jgi:sulfopyruvate decarboxylase subunit beta